MKLRKIIAVLVLICMIFTQQSTVVFAEVLAETIKENVKETSGTVGDNGGFSWVLEDGVLTVTGEDTFTLSENSPFSNITATKIIFKDCTFKGSLSYLLASTNVTEVVSDNCHSSQVTDMSYMYYRSAKINTIDMNDMDTSNVVNMESMFESCNSLVNLYMSECDTSNVTDMSSMFSCCTSLSTVDMSNFDTSNVTDMSSMFISCTSLSTVDVSNFDTSNVKYMSSMFSYCESINKLDLSNFNTSNVLAMNQMFGSCKKLYSLNISSFDTSNVTDMYFMFQYCTALESLDLSNFDTSSATNINSMFQGCSSLEELNVSSFNTSNVKIISGMFSGCSSLEEVDVSNFNTSNVTSLNGMFSGCSSLEEIDVSNFNTRNTTSFVGMFKDCASLKEIDLSNFNTSKVTNMSEMFSGCNSLKEIKINNFDTSKVTNMYAMFYNCSSLKELNLYNFNTSKVTSVSDMFNNCSSLTKLNLSSFDLSKLYYNASGYGYSGFLTNCSSLKIISTPAIIPEDIVFKLPEIFCDEAGNIVAGITSKQSGIVLYIKKQSFTTDISEDMFLFKVVDASNYPLTGVSVTYDGKIGYTNENGEVQFEKSDKEKPIFKISKDGYYTCSNENESYEFENEFYEKVVLQNIVVGHKTFKKLQIVTPIARKINLIEDFCEINLHGPGTFELQCELYDRTNVVRFELWQGDTLIASSFDGFFSFNSSVFKENLTCYIKVVNRDGTFFTENLKIFFGKKTESGEFEFGGSSVKLTVPDDVPLIGGSIYSFSTPELPLYYYNSPKGERFGINIQISDETTEDEWEAAKELIDASKKAIESQSKGKCIDKKAIEELKEMVKPDSMMLGGSEASVTVCGWLEEDKEDNIFSGQICVLVETKSPKFGWNTVFYVVPVTAYFQFEASGGVGLNITYDYEKKEIISDLKLDIDIGANLSLGIGAANIASAGVRGSANIVTEIGLGDIEPGLRKCEFVPAFGFYAEVGKFTYEHMFPGEPIPLYTKAETDSLNENKNANTFDASAYNVASLDYLANESDWNGYGIYNISSEVRTEFSSLLEDTYSNAKPMMVGNADAVYATFLRADEATGDVYAVVTKGVMGVWNDPVSVDADVLTDGVQQIDGSPQLFLDDDGNLWMAYTRTLEGDNTTLLGYAKNQRIVVGKVDKNTLEFTEMKEFASVGFAHTPQLTVVDGVPTLSWVEATVTDDNSVLAAKTNKIYKSTYSNGAWSDAVEVSSVNYYIHDIAIGNEGYGLIIDIDGDVLTIEDRTLKIYNWSATETASVEGVNGNVSYGCLPGQSTKTFIWNGDDVLCSTTASVETPGITGEYAVAEDKVYYSTNTGDSTNLVVVSKNSDGTFGEPVQLTYSSRYFENISVVEVGNNDVVLGMHTKMIITENDIALEKNLVWSIVQPVNDVSLEGVSVDKSVVTTGSDVPVTVWVKNNGLNVVEEVAIKVNDSLVSTQTVSLKPGEEKEITINIACPSSLTEYNIQVYDTSLGISADYTPDDNNATAEIGHSDVSVSAKIMYVGEKRVVTAVVENKGVAPVSGAVLISDKNGAEILKHEFSDLSAGKVVFVEQEMYDFISDESIGVSIVTDNEEIYTYNNSTTVYVPYYEEAPEEEEVTVTYTVKFDGNGATSGSMKSITCEYDKSYTLPANKFVRPGYTFDGWNTNAEGIGNGYMDESEIKNLTHENGSVVTLYAQWEEVEVNVPDGWNQAEDGNWYYYKDNKVDTTANGILKNGSEYWYAVKGKADFTVTTVARYQNQWWYVNKGKVDFTYTGLASNSSGTWYMKNGVLDTSVSGLIKIENKWWYLKGGKVDKAYNGLVKNAGKWWYIKDGTINFTYKGLVKNAGKWWYIANGTINFQFVGIVKNAGHYWYISNGQINFTYKGLVKNAGNWWFVQNGKIDLTYDGVATNSAGTWYIENGKLDATKNGIYARGGNYYYFTGGKVNTAVNGIIKNAGQYWYFEKGMINFKFVGIVDNAGSKWYVRNGKIDFSFSGTVTYNGYTYTIVNGRVEHIRR